MHKPRTPWPLEERIRLVAIFDELAKRSSGWTARRFAAFHDVPYSTFCRWLARFRRSGAAALRDRSHSPKRRPHKLSGQEETVIRQAHRALRCGVHRLYAYLRAAKLTPAQLRQCLPRPQSLWRPGEAQAPAEAQLAAVR